MLPTVASVAELDALRASRELWEPSVRELLESLGFRDAKLEDLGGGNLVLGVGEGHVLKLGPRAFERELLGEHAALPLVFGRLPVATPEPIAMGTLGDWLYVLMTRVPGRVSKTCWHEVPPSSRRAILFRIGRTLAAIHALPAPTKRWSTWLETELAACCARQTGWGVPQQLVDGMPACIARANLGPAPSVLLHGDLHDDNVMLVDNEISGIIDFGDAMDGDPIFDLVTPALLVARGDPVLLEALLDGYGIERTPALHAKLVAYSILHRWNDLTRYLGWSEAMPQSMDEYGRVLLPF